MVEGDDGIEARSLLGFFFVSNRSLLSDCILSAVVKS